MTVSNDPNVDPIDEDGSGDLARGLDRARAALDAEITSSGAGRRVTAAVLADAGVGKPHRLRWLAFAATLVIAAGLGGFLETTRLQATGGTEVVALDPLTFGALAADQ